MVGWSKNHTCDFLLKEVSSLPVELCVPVGLREASGAAASATLLCCVTDALCISDSFAVECEHLTLHPIYPHHPHFLVAIDFGTVFSFLSQQLETQSQKIRGHQKECSVI